MKTILRSLAAAAVLTFGVAPVTMAPAVAQSNTAGQATFGNLIAALNNITAQINNLQALNNLTVQNVQLVNVQNVLNGNNVQALNNALNQNRVNILNLQNVLNNNTVIQNVLNNAKINVDRVVAINVLSGGGVTIYYQ